METFAHQMLTGVAAGSVYACLALAMVMIHQATRLINFAQGEMAMFSTYLAWSLIAGGLPYWAAFVLTLGISFVAGVAIERAVLRPLARAPVLAIVIVFIGLYVIFNSLAGWIFSHTIKPFPSPFEGVPVLANRFVSAHELGVVAVILAVVGLLYLFFRHTRLGLAMRAAAENPESSRLCGIRVGWMVALGWGMAAALGAVAGMMVAPIVFLDPNMMAGVLLYAIAGALLGGIESPPGAVIGGILVGVIENLAGAYVVGTELKLSVALAVIVGVLALRPAGLFGRPSVARV